MTRVDKFPTELPDDTATVVVMVDTIGLGVKMKVK